MQRNGIELCGYYHTGVMYTRHHEEATGISQGHHNDCPAFQILGLRRIYKIHELSSPVQLASQANMTNFGSYTGVKLVTGIPEGVSDPMRALGVVWAPQARLPL
jgi:hypothetical protein